MFTHLEADTLVGRALWKYDDWQVSKLHTCKTRDEANRIEIECIRNFNSIAPNGYNLTRGGDGANYWSGKKRPEHSKFMQKNKYNRDISGAKNPMKDPNISKKLQGNKNAQGCKHSKQAGIKRNITYLKNQLEKLL